MDEMAAINDMARCCMIQATVAEACGMYNVAQEKKTRAKDLLTLDSKEDLATALDNIKTEQLIRQVAGW